ncbi:DUF2691 family protein [Sporosarcina oncorhynchi]|uniref:DUF2691 family protein n=1 Tax=Sporosarcina oncorhynchi TaxID=3056444 RepID=A0ABZ0L2V1_9BACL|nr:DUF2691 family protein [Sporosarcina sp. T2O-4]WOV86932.1 DUF2691 family protein [Sporosarcina sp. T2O-4]
MEGAVFYIRGEYGKQLYEILEGIVDPSWYWSVGPEESYFIGPGGLGDPFFGADVEIMDGPTFMRHISKEKYFLIFADIKAFPTSESVVEIFNENEFMKSSCKLGLFVSDSTQVIVYSRDKQIISDIFKRAETMGYSDIRLMTKEAIIAAIWGWMQI